MAVEAGLSVYVVGGQGVRLFVVVVMQALRIKFFLPAIVWITENNLLVNTDKRYEKGVISCLL